MRISTILTELPTIENIDGSQFQCVITGYIKGKQYTLFRSYQSNIVLKIDGMTFIDENKWDFSQTTSKFRNKFLRELGSETLAKIEKGQYKFANLN